MAEVVLKHVKKVYSGNVCAVKDFNLHIKDKEFVVFVGPSGCGKSTTLRMIAGLEDITGGTVSFDGQVVNDMQPKDRGIAMVFQNYALYPNLTVFENMAFPLRLQRPKLSNDEIYNRVVRAANILGITEYLTRKPKALSGGQRQRVAIGRAMVKDSRVFLMDEPLSNLDAKLRNQMRAEIILLREKIESTFIYVTHDQTEAMTLGDRIVVMKDGYIMQVGTPHEVFDQPANLFVAEFIGAPKMNTFDAHLAKKDGEYEVSAFNATIKVDGEKAEQLLEKGVEDQDIILGVRPEHIHASFEEVEGAIKVNLEVMEMMGSEMHLHTLTSDNHEFIVRIPTIGLSDEDRAKFVNNATLYLSFEAKAMHFFSKEDEHNLIYEYVPENVDEEECCEECECSCEECEEKDTCPDCEIEEHEEEHCGCCEEHGEEHCECGCEEHEDEHCDCGCEDKNCDECEEKDTCSDCEIEEDCSCCDEEEQKEE